MSGFIEHSGTVVHTEAERLYVRIVATSACGACHARGACGMGESQERIVEVVASDASSYAAGDAVTVAVRRGVGTRAVVLAYVGALAVLLVVLLTTVGALAWNERSAALAALGAVALYYTLLRLLRRRIERPVRFIITKR